MMIATRLIGCFSSRDDYFGIGRWFERVVGLGLVERRPRVDGERRYRFNLYIRFWLVPDLIWQKVFLGVERGEPVYQFRIIGWRGWPIKFEFAR